MSTNEEQMQIDQNAPGTSVPEQITPPEPAYENFRKRDFSTMDEDREEVLRDEDNKPNHSTKTPPKAVVRTMCLEAAEARFHAFNKKTDA
jgi:hypothetical protein